MEQQLIAPCGMNCALCANYLAMKHELGKKGFGYGYCPGCLPRGQHCLHMAGHCAIVGNGLVRFCYECESFPCQRLKALDKRYRTKYHLSMLDNLQHIREHGIESFLRDQETQWRCPRCGDSICCHKGLCLNCDLEVLRQNRKYRWGER